MSEKRKTYNVPNEKYLKLERLAIETSQKIGRSIKWTEVLSYMIDSYAKDAAIDMVSQEELKKKKAM
ncbi:TPA: hypothetical protein JLC23_002527 [Escherichia coli]|nr:hypothetical protein [Escherichia coli]HAV8304313.1 hypothetical protein [Escherichia coli]HAV8327420.1 hypothetical protein [Escherichia coli]